MCGIGILYSQNRSIQEREIIGANILRSLNHRGPDAQKLWSNNLGLTMIHTRLSIVDLSPTGQQPMDSANDLWTIVFNGEIYNHTELRNQYFQNFRFKGTSDTETLLALFEKFGPVEAITKTRGMFAIAAYNKKDHELILFRDRLGEKPLYYGWINKDFIVSSELKSFYTHPDFQKNIDVHSLGLFLQFNHIPQPHSIFKNVKKLPQGSWLKLDLKDLNITEPKAYWKLPDNLISREETNSKDNTIILQNKLSEVVKIQMRSDVPYGCFLSGGIDSSTIAALMQSQSKDPIKTFSIGFENPEYNEAPYAKKVANHLKTDHTEWIINSNDAKNVIPNLAEIYDEPFADSSQLPTYLLAKLTKQKVTVCLSGDGGDELFYGYNRYYWTNKIWKFVGPIPKSTRIGISNLLSLIPIKYLKDFYNFIYSFLPKTLRVSQIELKITKLIQVLKVQSSRELFFRTLQYWQNPNLVLANKTNNYLMDVNNNISNLNFFMMWHDQTHYLPDDIMVKVDRASMANSLETRAPFLDHELIELVMGFPIELRSQVPQKKLLRDILQNYIPKELIDRPKMGFGIPLKDWLKYDLKELTLDLLNPNTIKNQNLLDADYVSKILTEFYDDNQPLQDLIWPLVVFQIWYKKWI